jgi:hypothetical protein
MESPEVQSSTQGRMKEREENPGGNGKVKGKRERKEGPW